MSSHAIEHRERLIVALDVSSGGQARKLVETLGSSVAFYKVGLELFLSGDAFELLDLCIDEALFCGWRHSVGSGCLL